MSGKGERRCHNNFDRKTLAMVYLNTKPSRNMLLHEQRTRSGFPIMNPYSRSKQTRPPENMDGLHRMRFRKNAVMGAAETKAV